MKAENASVWNWFIMYLDLNPSIPWWNFPQNQEKSRCHGAVKPPTVMVFQVVPSILPCISSLNPHVSRHLSYIFIGTVGRVRSSHLLTYAGCGSDKIHTIVPQWKDKNHMCDSWWFQTVFWYSPLFKVIRFVKYLAGGRVPFYMWAFLKCFGGRCQPSPSRYCELKHVETTFRVR